MSFSYAWKERSARYRLFELVCSACLKTIDLWDEKIHRMRLIDTRIEQAKTKLEDLSARDGMRIDLEEQNKELLERLVFVLWIHVTC